MDIHPLIDETTNTINLGALMEHARQEIRGVLEHALRVGMTKAEIRQVLNQLPDCYPA